MNVHAKIKDIGFKRCEFHKPYYDPKTTHEYMILDYFEDKTEWVGFRKVVITKKKEHPKWDYFYKLKFSESVTIWMVVEKQSLIKNIWLESKSKINTVTILYDKYKVNTSITPNMRVLWAVSETDVMLASASNAIIVKLILMEL